MLVVDSNVLVYSHRPEAPRHEEFREWLEGARRGDEQLAVADHVLAGFVRIVTHPRVVADPTPLDVALELARALRSSPSLDRRHPLD